MRHRRIQKTSKHKKIKAVDPFYSGPRKTALFRSNKGANREPEEQRIPRKFVEFMQQKEQLEYGTGTKKSKSRNKFATTPGAPAHVEFKQGKYETMAHFCKRMDKAAQEAITKAELEVQFDVNFEREGKDKLVISKRKAPDTFITKSGAPVDSEESLPKTKSQKRKLKDAAKKEEKRLDRYDGFSMITDEVEFGEVAEAPPDIKSAPRKAPDVKRMGEKILLLNKVLNPEPDELPERPLSIFDNIPEATNASVKRARQEELRTNAVEAYRQLKKQKTTKKRPASEFD